ncbi:class I SAM-dependent methyltransferase [Aneurinibacillus terranovensis]|uniref:class I SAM-dependent methyltransferase n=1 Tax=Aneurinibacillus terranovensis TaxID=278991 RepID=UPI0004076E06|nr:SAM-dependent methyltransferase [Aneurinibacillus terranovensis]
MNQAHTLIKQTIRQSQAGYIPFRQFMELALYSPGGYYQQQRAKVGKAGDFYTNASVHAVFGATIAEVIAKMLSSLEAGSPLYVVEMGGGPGELSGQILHSWQQNGLPVSKLEYIMIETSGYHKKLQQARLEAFAQWLPIHWFESIAEARKHLPCLTGVCFSNELPDAFPVHLIERKNGRWMEVCVTIENDAFTEVTTEIINPELLAYCEREQIPGIEGYRTEVNLESMKWMKEVADWLSEGYNIIIDYGYTREELYAPSRRGGTLLCYREHQISEDLYEHVGEQDMTSHVNFSALMEAGEEKGLRTLSLDSQGDFLVKAGILERLQAHDGGDPFRNEAARRNRAIRQLIMQEGMGGTFKVLVQQK